MTLRCSTSNNLAGLGVFPLQFGQRSDDVGEFRALREYGLVVIAAVALGKIEVAEQHMNDAEHDSFVSLVLVIRNCAGARFVLRRQITQEVFLRTEIVKFPYQLDAIHDDGSQDRTGFRDIEYALSPQFGRRSHGHQELLVLENHASGAKIFRRMFEALGNILKWHDRG